MSGTLTRRADSLLRDRLSRKLIRRLTQRLLNQWNDIVTRGLLIPRLGIVDRDGAGSVVRRIAILPGRL